MTAEVAGGTQTAAFGTVTMTIASPAVVSYTAHGLAAGDIVTFSTTGALPTGVVAGTAYYVIAAGLTANAFEISATAGGAAINTTGSQSGVHSLVSEHFLNGAAFTTAANYVLDFDLTNLSGSSTTQDVIELRVYKTSRSGGTERINYSRPYSGPQTEPLASSPPIVSPFSCRFSMKQTAGTARSFEWSVKTP